MNEDERIKEQHKKHNAKRTKNAQTDNLSRGTKRRVNITIDGDVWDEIENLDIESKSKFIEDLLKQKIKQAKKKK